MDTRENLALWQAAVVGFFRDLSRVLTVVEQKMRDASFAPVGDSAVFQDISTAFDRSARWLPRYLARAYVKGKKPNRAVGFCIHLGPYTDPATVAYLQKSRLALPFVSLACLRDMQPGPLEVDRRQIWDRLWDSGWWATYEDHVSGPLRVYHTTREISGFQATIAGALLDLFPMDTTTDVAQRIVTPLQMLHEGQDEELRQLPQLLIRP
ncbi:MAG: hypothetical protein GYA36_06705 [Veillonellaceae bacterium]|nr:hypothetical protein [Veillonellaceae bacterium]